MKKQIKVFWIFLMALVMLIPQSTSDLEAASTDVTSLVTFGEINVYTVRSGVTQYVVKDGVTVNETTINENDGVYFDFTWQINASNLAQINADDYFYVTLPNEYVKFTVNGTKSNVTDASSGNVIGEVELIEVNGEIVLKVTLNQTAVDNYELTNGKLNAYGVAQKQGTVDYENNEGTGEVTAEFEIGPPTTNPIGDDVITGETTISKHGYFSSTNNEIEWDIYLFQDNLVTAYHNVNGHTSVEPEEYKNVILVDQLTADQTLTEVDIYSTGYVATSDGHMASQKIVNFIANINNENRATIPEISPAQGAAESDADFEDRIKNATEICYGVTSSNKVIVNLQDSPNYTSDTTNGAHNSASFISTLTAKLDEYLAAGRIDQNRYDKTLDTYTAMYAKYGETMFMPQVTLKTTTTATNGTSITNEATVYWDGGEEVSNEVKVTVNKVGGSAEGVPAGTIIIKKVDGDTNDKLSNVTFELQKDDGLGNYTKLGDYTTDANGEITVSGLGAGNYRVKETNNANSGYGDEIEYLPTGTVDSDGYYYFTLDNTVGIEINVKNYLDLGDVELIKTNKDGSKVLEGAEFTLYDSDDKKIAEKLTTDSTGKLSYEDLEPGDYYFVETKAPDGYKLDATPITFTIVSGQTKTLTVCKINELLPGKVELTKKDVKDGSVLVGAEFTLYDSDDKKVAEKLTTDSTGKLSYEDLEPGDYYFVETKAPDGYVIDTTAIPFTITGGNSATVTVEMTNELIKGAVILTKSDSTNGDLLSGAEFDLYDDSGSIIGSYTTTAAGTISVNNLEPGDYYFVETKAPSGYKLDTTPINFTIEKGQTTALTIDKTNELLPGKVELTKTDKDTGSALSGAEFSVYDSKDNLLSSGHTTDSNGKLSVEDLEPGDYYFVETKAPDGYVIDTTSIPFTITGGNSETVTVEMTNETIKGAVILSKVDSSDNKLSGAEFDLYNESGLIIGSYTTNSEGIISVNNLESGNYYFVETKAPSGYQLDISPVTFTIEKGSNAIVEVSKENVKIPEKHPSIQPEPPVDDSDRKFEFYSSASVATSDHTNRPIYYIMLLVSFSGLLLLRKSRNTKHY